MWDCVTAWRWLMCPAVIGLNPSLVFDLACADDLLGLRCHAEQGACRGPQLTDCARATTSIDNYETLVFAGSLVVMWPSLASPAL
eukprot:4182549-Pleurochrysis_carterae.AAC.1